MDFLEVNKTDDNYQVKVRFIYHSDCDYFPVELIGSTDNEEAVKDAYNTNEINLLAYECSEDARNSIIDEVVSQNPYVQCPVCMGEGELYSSDQNYCDTTHECKDCDGQGVLDTEQASGWFL